MCDCISTTTATHMRHYQFPIVRVLIDSLLFAHGLSARAEKGIDWVSIEQNRDENPSVSIRLR
ncbi:MAG: hypothetical protein QG670_740 [Thermoproteota archaeon]|nr:hypothetical protein [Thermoproteota archaeon]